MALEHVTFRLGVLRTDKMFEKFIILSLKSNKLFTTSNDQAI